MNGLLASLICCLVTLAAATSSAPSLPRGASPEGEARAEKWLRDLHEMGIRVEGDSLHVSDEARRVMTDSAYRKVIYPETYQWGAVKQLIDAQQMKIAVWYLINLCEADAKYREAALKMLVALDGPLEMDKVLVSTFYTYGVLDPRVCSLKSGHPEVTRPDLAEQRMNLVKDIIDKIMTYRKIKQQRPDSTHDSLPSGGER